MTTTDEQEHIEAVAKAAAEGVSVEVFAILDAMTPEHRAMVVSCYCQFCGSISRSCQCENDE